MINFRPVNKFKPAKGRLLISEPFLQDPYFKRTVVLLCEHNDKGSYGFVLNKYIDLDIDEVIDEFPHLETRISLGGPVQDTRLFYIHTLGDQIEGSIEIKDGIYIGGEFDVLKDLIESNQVDQEYIRFFIGYAGWSENQLQEELEEHAWLVAPGDGLDLMDTSTEKLWSHVLTTMGKEYANLAKFPEDPSLN